jgi:cytochrome c oxidase assembly factor CtaG
VADIVPLGGIVAVGAFYGAGVARVWQRAGRGRIVRVWQTVCFGTALVTLAIAFASGLDAAAQRSLAAHMAQHVLLISVAAPLLVLGAPIIVTSYALDVPESGRRLGLWFHRFGGMRRTALVVGAAFVLHTSAVGIWHLPAAYGAALTNPLLHAIEHASFLLTAMFLWWAVLGAGRRLAGGAGVLVLFVVTLPMNALGLLMTLAHSPWYAAYTHHTSMQTALDDQAVAGVIMWGFGGVATLVGAFALFVAWLQGMERATPGRARTEGAVPVGTAAP